MDTPVAFQHPAWWTLRALNQPFAHPDQFINFRVIQNLPPDPSDPKRNTARSIFNENIPIANLKSRWGTDLLNKLSLFNNASQPGNIYYGVNPRLSAKGNNLADVPFYHAFYLDCDANKSFTLEDRWRQIVLWIKCGIPPSFIIFTGHGFHPYWLLARACGFAEGRAILQPMVELAGCKDKGNTFDSTRVLRLPGFRNVKHWFDATPDTPDCSIVYPEDWAQRDPANPQHVARYDPLIFKQFPPSQKADLVRYTQHAASIGGDSALDDKVAMVMKQAMATVVQQQVQMSGTAIAAENMDRTGVLNTENLAAPTQSKQVVPSPEDVKWRKGRTWMKKYCTKGYAALRQDEIDELAERIKSEDKSASAFDFKVMLELVMMGYTLEAIRDFWYRADTKLHRPDKEAKNPGYFDMSYGKAQAYAQSIFDQNKEKQANTQPKIREVEYTVVDKTNNQAFQAYKTEFLIGEKYVDMLNCHMSIESIYENPYVTGKKAEKTHYAVTVTQNEFKKHTTIVPRSFFSSATAIRSLPNVQYFIDSTAPLQFLLEYLIVKCPNPVKRLHDKMTYVNGYYDFPYYRITADKIEKTVTTKFDDLMIEHFVENNEYISACIKNIQPYEEVKTTILEIWPKLLGLHVPEVLLPIFGTIGACALRPMMEHKCNITMEVPTVNLRGLASMGKSHTARILMQLCGFKDNRSVHMFSAARTSIFAFEKILSSLNCVPLAVDEFKEEGDNGQQLDAFRNLVRRIYTGETQAKGRADLSYTIFRLRGTMIVLGEHPLERTGNVAEVSRIFPVDVYEHQTDRTKEVYEYFEDKNFSGVSPYFYQFLLNQDATELHRELKTLKHDALAKLSNFAEDKNRIAPNVAIMRLGIRVLDRFIQSIDASLPSIESTLNFDKNVVDKLNEYALSTAHTVKYKDDEGKTVLKNRDESIDFLAILFEIADLKTQEWLQAFENGSFIFDVKEDKEIVRIKFTAAYTIYAAFCRRTGAHTISKEKLKRLFKRPQPYIITDSKVARIKEGVPGEDDAAMPSSSTRLLILSLPQLRAMGIFTQMKPTKVENQQTNSEFGISNAGSGEPAF